MENSIPRMGESRTDSCSTNPEWIRKPDRMRKGRRVGTKV